MNSDIFYKRLYLKYKSKYLELKQRGGGPNTIIGSDTYNWGKKDDKDTLITDNDLIVNTKYYINFSDENNKKQYCYTSLTNKDKSKYTFAKCSTNKNKPVIVTDITNIAIIKDHKKYEESRAERKAAKKR